MANMTKKQKIWLGISLAMFLIPELLWSPVGNFYYELWMGTSGSSVFPFRNNAIVSNDDYWKYILCLQLIGVSLALYLLIKAEVKNYFFKYFMVFLLFAIFILVAFAFYFAISFNPQIG